MQCRVLAPLLKSNLPSSDGTVDGRTDVTQRERFRSLPNGATIEDTSVDYRGKSVPAQRIRLAPYLDDSLRGRFEKLASKQYVFTLSSAVPGGVVSILAQVSGTDADVPLLAEALWLDGTAPPAALR